MKHKKEPTQDLAEEVTPEGMIVVKTGFGVYTCSSETKAGDSYSVDVLGYGGLGSCTCDDFVCRKKPKWSGSGHRKFLSKFRCKHIHRVRSYLMDGILAVYIEQESAAERRARINQLEQTQNRK